jgi:hypothetical protein
MANKRGLGSDNMSEEDKERIHREGGKASAESPRGAAGKTEAAKRGGEHSRGGGRRSEE